MFYFTEHAHSEQLCYFLGYVVSGFHFSPPQHKLLCPRQPDTHWLSASSSQAVFVKYTWPLRILVPWQPNNEIKWKIDFCRTSNNIWPYSYFSVKKCSWTTNFVCHHPNQSMPLVCNIMSDVLDIETEEEFNNITNTFRWRWINNLFCMCVFPCLRRPLCLV